MNIKELEQKLKDGTITEQEKRLLAQLTIKKKNGKGRTYPGGKGGNDPRWWTKYKSLTEDSANFPFNQIAGTPIQTGQASQPLYGLTTGVLLEYVRTIGHCPEANSAFNYQMRNLWLAMHRKYRGLGAYEWADLGIAMFSIICAFGDIARAERIYAATSAYSAHNRSLPTTLLKALRFYEPDISGDRLADFRYELNRIIIKAKTLCLPRGISALECFLGLDANVFKDSDSNKATWFVYDTAQYVLYDPSTQSTGGSAVYKARTRTGTGSTQTFADIIKDLNTVFDALLGDTDIARICSDVLACFGENGTVMLAELPENYTLELVRDDTRLLQLHNTTLIPVDGGINIPTTITLTGLDTKLVYQQGGYCHQELVSLGGAGGSVVTAGGAQHYLANNAINDLHISDYITLDIWKDDVSIDDKVEMTRFAVGKTAITKTVSGSTKYGVALTGYGIAVVSSMHLYVSSGDSGQLNVGVNPYAIVGDYPAVKDFYMLSQLTKIDWHPQLWLLDDYSGGQYLTCLFYDMDNYTQIDKVTLSRLHDACTLSAFKVEVAENSIKDN